MLNPNICKRIRVIAESITESGSVKYQFVDYQGTRLEVNEIRHGFLKPGSRYAYLRYSITSDRYYVTAK
jgi:hypothetical protein